MFEAEMYIFCTLNLNNFPDTNSKIVINDLEVWEVVAQTII